MRFIHEPDALKIINRPQTENDEKKKSAKNYVLFSISCIRITNGRKKNTFKKMIITWIMQIQGAWQNKREK